MPILEIFSDKSVVVWNSLESTDYKAVANNLQGLFRNNFKWDITSGSKLQYQQDLTNCGAFMCFFAERLVYEKIPDEINKECASIDINKYHTDLLHKMYQSRI